MSTAQRLDARFFTDLLLEIDFFVEAFFALEFETVGSNVARASSDILN